MRPVTLSTLKLAISIEYRRAVSDATQRNATRILTEELGETMLGI